MAGSGGGAAAGEDTPTPCPGVDAPPDAPPPPPAAAAGRAPLARGQCGGSAPAVEADAKLTPASVVAGCHWAAVGPDGNAPAAECAAAGVAALPPPPLLLVVAPRWRSTEGGSTPCGTGEWRCPQPGHDTVGDDGADAAAAAVAAAAAASSATAASGDAGPKLRAGAQPSSAPAAGTPIGGSVAPYPGMMLAAVIACARRLCSRLPSS